VKEDGMPGEDPTERTVAEEMVQKVGCGRLLVLLVLGPLLPFAVFFGARPFWGDEAALAAAGLVLVLFTLYVLFIERPRLERRLKDG
jgi:hypothetical protein